MKTLYSALGLDPHASDEQIRGAFVAARTRRMQQENAGGRSAEQAERDLQAWRSVELAYATLSNQSARDEYDAKLARLGVDVGSSFSDAAPGATSGLVNGRTLLIVCVVALVLGGGYWIEQSNAQAERARAKVALERAQEAEKKRLAEEEGREAALEKAERRQALDSLNSKAERERSDRLRAAAEAKEMGAESADNERALEHQQDDAAAIQQRQALHAAARAQAESQAATERATRAAEDRAAAQKQALRETCMQRYNRPDC